MAWAKVDDQWFAHRKVVGLSLAARGLWTTVLSWSCAQRTAHVPAYMARFLAGEPVDDEAEELVSVGMWVEDGDGWRIHDWEKYQERSLSEKRAEAGRKGGRKSKPPSNEEANGKQTDLQGEANGEAGALPGPSLPNPKSSTPSPDGDDGGESDAEDPPQDSIDVDKQRFEEHFWPLYPATNGRKPEKGKALAQWRKLTVEQQRRAVIGARSLARSDTIPKHAHRFLRKDTSGEFPFDDWQEQPRRGEWPSDACQKCGQGMSGHDVELCTILAKAG